MAKIVRWLLVVLAGGAGFLLLSGCTAGAAPCVANWIGPDGGNFNVGANWNTGAAPAPADHACSETGTRIVIDDTESVASVDFQGELDIQPGASVTFSSSDASTITKLSLSGGTLSGPGMIVVGGLDWSGGAIGGAGYLSVLSFSPSTIHGDVELDGGRTLGLLQTVTWASGQIRLCDNATIDVGHGGDPSGAPLLDVQAAGAQVTGTGCAGAPGSAHVVIDPGAVWSQNVDSSVTLPFVNRGTVDVATGKTLALASLQQPAGFPSETHVRSGATVRVGGGAGTLTLDGGLLTGTGTVDASVANAGTVAPGDAAGAVGTLTVAHDVSPNGGHTRIDVTPGGTDQLAVLGAADVNGDGLEVDLAATPAFPSSVTPVTGAPVSGTFGSVDLVGAGGVGAHVVYSPAQIDLHFNECDVAVFHPGADNSGLDVSGKYLAECDLSNENLTGATLTGANITDSSIRASNLSDVVGINSVVGLASTVASGWQSTNFAGSHVDLNAYDLDSADFTSTNFFTAFAMETASITGVTWSNTTCPDNTNSDDHANTCVGHFDVDPIVTLTHGSVGGWNNTVPVSVTINVVLASPSVPLVGDPVCTVDTVSTPVTGTGPWTVDVAGAVDGDHAVSCDATDTAGGSGNGTDTVRTDTTAPTIDVVHDTNNPATVTITASDGTSGLAGDPTCTVDTVSTPVTGTGPWEIVVSGAGAHTVSCDIADIAGNTSNGVDTFTLSNEGPDCPTLQAWTAPDPLATGLDARYCDLTNKNLDGADLTGDNLSHATLTHATLIGTTLTAADLSSAQLDGANLTNAVVTGANLDSTIFHGGGDPATVTGASFVGATNIGSGDISDTALNGWHNTDFSGTGILLNGTFFGDDMRGVNLEGALAAGATFQGVDLTGAHLAGAHLTPAAFDSVTAPGIDLSGVDASGFSVSNSDLSGANLTNGDFGSTGGSTVTATNLSSADLTGANFTAATFGPDPTNLNNAVLTNTQFSSASFQLVTFLSATLDATDFTAAVFDTSDLTGAAGTPTVTVATHWFTTTCPDTYVANDPDTCSGHFLP